MKFYLIAGEASGDLQGAALVKALRSADPNAELRCWGGELMAEAGAEVVKHYRELAFMGFVEVVKNLPAIIRNFKQAKKDILSFKPDCLILIDYPGFNLRMATWAKKHGIRIFYYISPQLWAWHTSRVKIIKDCVERMFVIFPFEVDFYKKHGVEVSYIGHPLAAVIAQHTATQDFFSRNGLERNRPIIALLPGSRRQEVERMLATMLEVVPRFAEYQFIVAGAPSLGTDFYKPFLLKGPPVNLVTAQTYDLLAHAHAALVTSGTATLETALFMVPQVVCYKAGSSSYRLARMLVNKDLKFISIVNLIAGKEVVRELIQDDFKLANAVSALAEILMGPRRNAMLAEYQAIGEQLGELNGADLAANEILDCLKSP
ncbi:MAG: lipid-A-disaccharide synthase [Saprospiraceae bacterium]|nr:lipid-A-disaccharide synthase [Saprospiraceae bacterium]